VEEAAPPIPAPDPLLEQYTTPGDIAARLAHTVAMRDPLSNARVADLGAGTCRLSLALALYGAPHLTAVDADPRLPLLCISAFESLGLEPPSYLVSMITRAGGPLRPGSIDVVVMNPPFGVQRRGADTVFLAYAMVLGADRIYAILKTGNEDFHTRLAKEYGYRHVVLYRELFPLPATMKHHRSRIRRVEVNVSVFERIH